MCGKYYQYKFLTLIRVRFAQQGFQVPKKTIENASAKSRAFASFTGCLIEWYTDWIIDTGIYIF